MREILLQFEGHEESEKKAADAIQAAIFTALHEERMNVRSFVNQSVKGNTKVVIGTPGQLQKEFDIPAFLTNSAKKGQAQE